MRNCDKYKTPEAAYDAYDAYRAGHNRGEFAMVKWLYSECEAGDVR